MSSKVTLTYENHNYVIQLGEAILAQEKDEEKAILAFKNAVKNNTGAKLLGFEEMIGKVKALHVDEVEINQEYQTMQIGSMKYFYHTGKVFYTGEGKMVLLLGGFEYFYNILNLVAKKQIESSNQLVQLCAKVIEKDATYSLIEEELRVSSAAFSYGNIGFNFAKGKLNKGTASEQSNFETFKEFVLRAL